MCGRFTWRDLVELRAGMTAIGAALLLLVASIGNALAWGDEGHRIVAEIAEQYLEPAAARHVYDLLAIENAQTLAQVSTWADQIPPQRGYTAPWHFVDVPIHPPPGTPAGYDAARDCPHDDCVVAAIDRFAAVLRDKGAAPRKRLEALKFVVHLVGDIHQPLHCADNGDHGGNDVRVFFLGRPMSLHAVWDIGLLAPAVRGDERAYALRLVRSIAPGDLPRWGRGSSADWATESYKIARAKIYGEMQYEARTLELFWESELLPVVNEQLEKAGVRLAALLNATLR